jgi:hypothetical protein
LWAGAADEPARAAGPSCPVQPERDVRVKRAQRGQITWGRVDLDAEVPADHEVRAIAAVVDKLDLRGLYADVRARGEIAGAPATDPKTLLGLWVYPPVTASARVVRSRDSSTPRRLPLVVRRRRRRRSSPITASTTSAATTVTSSASS